MTAGTSIVESGRVCPFLGLPDDPDTRFYSPDQGHRCWAQARPEAVGLSYQADVCMAGSYQSCRRFRSASRPIPRWHPAAAAASASGASATGTRTETLAIAEPGPVHLASKPSRPAQRRRSVSALVPRAVLVVVVIALAFVALEAYGGNLLGSGPAGQPSFPAGGPSAFPSESAATFTPLASAQQYPTASPRPAPTPKPTPVIHIVQRGETLSSIAALYGVGVQQIEDANHITDPNFIYPGEQLIIP